ncbi:MAG: hypothetical protein ABSC26_06230 [Stellaceae bacterium]|jgi:hypothetical protein
MTNRALLAAALAAACLPFAPALADGPYDGSWNGTVSEARGCWNGTVTMQIASGAVSGSFRLRGGKDCGRSGHCTFQFKGTVAADGSVDASYGYPKKYLNGTMDGKIADGAFAGVLTTTTPKHECLHGVNATRP